MKKTRIWLIILIIATGGGYYWFRTKQTEPEKGPAYDTTAVERRDLKVTVESTGEVEPRNRLNVKPPIAGRLEELLVDEGQTVKKGEILGWVSSTERATLLDAARATSQQELEHWQKQYKPTPLVCPMAGTLIVRDFEPGQTITANDSIVVIADDLIIVANLDETDIGLIQTGQTVEVILEAYPDRPFPCVVEKIAYDAKTVSNVTMYEVDVRPRRLPAFARSGMTADLEFIIEEKSNALSLPVAAIQQKPGERTGRGGDDRNRPDVSSMGQDERRQFMMERMRERGLSDSEIQDRLARGTERGSPGRSRGRDRRAETRSVSYVLAGRSDAPKEVVVKTGMSDGSHTEITEGLEEGESVLIPNVMMGSDRSRNSKNSLLMGGSRGKGPRR